MIIAIAQRLGVHPAVVCVMWAVRRCQVPIPFTTRRANDLAHLRGAVDNRLNDDDMAAIDRNGRLIKGQVFLWEEGQRWEDLWDVNGVMTPPCVRSIMATMQGVIPPGNSTVEFRNPELPEPGHGQVLVRMKASSICGSDIRAVLRAHLGKGAEVWRGALRWR